MMEIMSLLRVVCCMQWIYEWLVYILEQEPAWKLTFLHATGVMCFRGIANITDARVNRTLVNVIEWLDFIGFYRFWLRLI